jgi:anaerobic magnesium-protoporphyrin IX monomethyl ester cyclase
MKNFKVLLVYANKMMENLIPINISVLSAVLKEAGFDVRLFDTTYYRTEEKSTGELRVANLQIRDYDLSKHGIHYKKTDIYEDFRNTVLEYGPDIVGVSAVEDTYKTSISLLGHIRDLGIPTVMGGVHAIISPAEVLNEPLVDMVCTGEGEYSFVNLCDKMHRKEDYTDVCGIWFKAKGKIIKNPPEKLVDINKLPCLDFSIYEKERFYRPMQGKVYRMLPVETSRGCPFACSYCAAPTLKEIYRPGGKYYRKKKIEKVIYEIEFYKSRYNLDYVYFTSETFLSMTDDEFNRFVALYKKIGLPFWFQTRPETIREYRIKILEGINCNRITVGIESGNERIRKERLNRKISNDSMIKAFDILKRSTIPFSVNNIIGIPDETRKEVFDTIELNRIVRADSISVFIFTPYRGTRLRQYCIEKGYISRDAYSSNHAKESILNMPSMSAEEILGLVRTFPLYVKFPREYYGLIGKAEKFDAEGNKVFENLSEKYRKECFK